MNTNRGPSSRTRQRAITLAIGVALAAIAAATRADVTIVSEVNVTGGMNRGAGGGRGFGAAAAAQQFPKTVSLYYKGDKARSEEKGGPVTIYDAAAGKIYTLDTAKKTYYEQSLAEIASGAQRFARPGAEPPPPSKVTLKETGDTQTIAAKKAAKYSVDGSLSFGFGGGFGGGGFGRGGGGGGFGGGGGQGGRNRGGGDANGGPPPDGAADDGQGGGNRRGRRAGGGRGGFGAGMTPPTTKVTGAIWFSDTVTLPAGKKATALPSAQLAAAGAPGLTQPLTEMLNKQGQLPLRSEITTTITFPARPNPDDDGSGGASPAPMEIKTVTTSLVKSISSRVLGAALFAVPAGYKKVDPPARGFGFGRGGRRGQGGAGGAQGGFGGSGGRRGGFGGGPRQDGGGPPMNGNDNGGGAPPMNGNDNGGGFGPPPSMDGGDDGGGPPMDGGDFGPPPPMDGGEG